MMGWRRNQPHAWRRMTYLGDPWIDLAPWQLPTLTRFSSLRHLDLQLLGVDQVKACHSKTARRHLLNGTIAGIAVFIHDIACRVFTTFAGVTSAANSIHGDRQRFVCFLAD